MTREEGWLTSQGSGAFGLSKDNLAAVGRIALAATSIEMLVESMIWTLLEVDEAPGRAVTEDARPSWLGTGAAGKAQRH